MNEALKAIKTDIHNQQSIFVFPTNVAATAWAELLLKEEIVDAVSLDRFIAWDTFKADCIRSSQQNKTSIPATLRKFFAMNMIEKNKKNIIFSSIINPEYLHTSASFSDWIAGILPQLAGWEEKILSAKLTLVLDEEDNDLRILKREYQQFLDSNNLFDPAWERPPFFDDGNTYFVIYPEILADFSEYKEILEQTKTIRLIHLEKTLSEKTVLQYTNTRSELRETALFIRELCKPIEKGGKGLSWNDVAISVADISSFEKYIEKDFSLYNIPFSIRSGKTLGDYPIGKLFVLIKNCYTENFSFNSIKNLILDPVFPWKNLIVQEHLIEFGMKYNCLCSYDGLDVWLDAFQKVTSEERASEFYKQLKKSITSLVTATSFSYIMQHYIAFRNTFFDMSILSDEQDKIMSRCITELSALIELEKDFPDATHCEDPYSFFIEQLSEKEYVLQSAKCGVNIFPYKLATCAPFRQHIIIDSSQASLTISNQRLHFLRDDKRSALGIKDENVSNNFIELYTQASNEPIRFSFSQSSLNGFQIPFNGLQPKEVITSMESETNITHSSYIDNYLKERGVFLNGDIQLDSIHSLQKEGFTNWAKTFIPHDENELEQFIEVLKSIIKNKFYKGTRLQVSATTLKSFYECPIKWIFTKVLKLEDYIIESTLLDDVFLGTFYHEVIKRVLTTFKKAKNPLSVTSDNLLSVQIQGHIADTLNMVIDDFPHSCGITGLSNLTIEIFISQKDIYLQKIIDFFTMFSLYFNGSYIRDVELEIQVEKDEYDLVGKIDCILDFPGNDFIEQGIFIIDFKTGNSPARNICIKQKDNDIKDFQLPLYVYMYEQLYLKEREFVQGCAYTSIHRKTIMPLFGILKPEGKSVIPFKIKDRLFRFGPNEKGYSFEPTVEATLEAVKGIVNALCDERLSLFTSHGSWGTFPNNTSVKFDTCLSCQFKTFCRTTYTISGGNQ